MNLFKSIQESFKKDPPIDDAYWQKRWEDGLKGKAIVKRYLVCFGEGHYGDFCGIKEITGYYDKTYSPYDDNKSYEDNWNKDVDIFYQIDFDNSRTLHGHKSKRCFATKENAQRHYNTYVNSHIMPLETIINTLNAAIKEV